MRARKFDPEAAVGQFTDTEKWRKTLAIDEVFQTIDINEYEETRRLVRMLGSHVDGKPSDADFPQYPMWVGRRDKRGFPVYVFEVGALDPSKVSATDHAASLK